MTTPKGAKIYVEEQSNTNINVLHSILNNTQFELILAKTDPALSNQQLGYFVDSLKPMSYQDIQAEYNYHRE